MAICNHLANNGAKSLLYQSLEQEYGADKAHDIWTAVRTQEFLNKHDWIDDIDDKIIEHLDQNGEPTISWVKDQLKLSNKATSFTNHSGGAIGADTVWDTTGREFGVEDHRHYWHGNKTPNGNVEISDADLAEGWKHVLEANKTLNRKPDKYKSLLSRNWFQVKNAEAVYAISTLKNSKTVEGGTGWAVQMAIDSKKPVYVYDQKYGEWAKYNYSKNQFEKTTTPKLTNNFAGIGTREINALGKEAIRDVYKKTLTTDIAHEPVDVPPLPLKQPDPTEGMESFNLEPTDNKIRGVVNRDSEEVMTKKVKEMYDLARQNPNKQYNVNYEFKSDKHRYRSGYTAKELANLFDTGDVPSNIRFPASFQRIIDNSTQRILSELSIKPPELINRNEEIVNREASSILFPKRDSDGKLSGFFSSTEQQDIIDSAMYAVHNMLLKDEKLGLNSIIKTFKGFQAMSERDPSSAFKDVFANRVRVADEMLDQMATLGYKIDQATRNKILTAVDNVADLRSIEAKGLDEDHPEYDHDIANEEGTEFIEAEGHGLADWGEVSFEHDYKETASGRMKMFIAMQPDMDRGTYIAKEDGVRLDKPAANLEKWASENPRDLKRLADQVNRKGFWMQDEATTKQMKTILDSSHPLLPTKNFMGLPKLVDFEATFKDILQTLADSPVHDFATYLNSLQATGRPNLLNLSEALGKADQQVQNEFARLVSMQYTNFSMLLFNKIQDDDGTSHSLKVITSNRYSQLSTIIKNWKEQQKLSEITKINEIGHRVIDVERATKWTKALDTLKKLDYSKEENIAKAKKYMQDVFRISGVSMSDDMMDSLFSKMEKWTKGTSVAGGLSKQFSSTEDGQPNGMFSAFIMKMAGQSNSQDIDDVVDNRTDLENRAEINNPLYTENTTMNILAKVAAQYIPTLHSGTFKSSEGKDIWDYSMHTKLSHQMLDLKENWDDFKARYDNVDIAKDNKLLDTISKIPQYRESVRLQYMDGMRPAWGKRGTTRGNMSDREQLLMSLSLFQNQGNGFNKIPKVHYMSLTHSDKTTSPLFMNMPSYDFGGVNEIPVEHLSKMGSTFYNVFKSEYQRIIKQTDKNFNDSRYDKGKGLFYFLPDFNKESMQKMVHDGFLTDREFKSIWLNGETLTKSISKDTELPVINKILRKVTDSLIQHTKDTWDKNGVTTEDTNLFDKEYLRKLLDKNGIKQEKKKGEPTVYSKDGNTLSKQEVNTLAKHAAAKDYSLNYFIHDVGLSQLFYGDPAMTFKGNVDLTLKEYGKRLAKDIAPGLDPYFAPEDKIFKSIVLADHNQSEKYLENLGNIFPDYKKVNATDAQEFTTVKEHLTVMYANGQISSGTYKDMMNIVKSNSGKDYKFTNPDHLAVIMQPQKPVFAGQRNVENGAMLEDYVKTSSIPLYPPALKGLELDNLRQLMEKQDIARAPFESGKKIGSPTNPVQFFAENGEFKMPNDKDIQGATRMLDRSGFRIQQEVPYDEEKEAIKTVSQMNKLIVEGINDMTGFKIGDKLYNGQEIRDIKEDIRKKMIYNQYKDFLKEFGVDTGKIMDKGVVYDKLIQLAKNSNNFTKNEVMSLMARDKDGNLFIPLQYNTGADKFESMLMSMVKDISQVKMPGKSFVQASSVGWTFKKLGDVKESDIVWNDSYDGGQLKTLRNELGEMKAAQVLVPFSFLDEAGLQRDIKDYTKEVNGRKVIDTSKIPKELMQLIGARIPNQGHSSMAPIEIVGFLPKNMGDTVVVPAAFTKQMGADFDVDKLFTYRRAYQVKTDITSKDTKPAHDNMQVPDKAYNTIDYGERKGTPEDEAGRTEVNNALLSGTAVAKEGETLKQVEGRVIPAFKQLLEDAPNNAVLVTHSSILRLLAQWEQQGRGGEIDPGKYINQNTGNGDVVPFKSKNGTLWVVRHGETEDNQAGEFRADNTQLTGKGIQQARESGQILKEQIGGPIPKMYTSALDRAVHTGNIINDEVNGTTDLKTQKLEAMSEGKGGLQNDYFNVHWSVLTHPDMAEKILQPLDKPDLKNENELLQQDKSEGYNYFDHVNQLEDYQNGKDAKKLVALASLAVTFNALIQDKNLHYMTSEPEVGDDGGVHMVNKKAYITLKDEHSGKTMELSKLSGNGKSHYTKVDGGDRDKSTIRSKSDNQSTIQSAAVDNAKDRALDNLNINPHTFPAASTLMQMETDKGEAVNLKYVTRLLTQPIIKEFAAEMKKGNDSLSEAYDPKLKENIFRKLFAKYTPQEEFKDIVFDPQLLKKVMNMDPDSESFKEHQTAALRLFMQLDDIGKRKSELQSLFNQDTQGAGPNLLTALDKQDKVNRLEQAPIGGAGDIYTKEDKITEAGLTFDSTTNTASKILTQILPYDKYRPLFNNLTDLSGKTSMSINDQRDVLRAVRSFTYNSGEYWWRNADAERGRLFYTQGDGLSLSRKVDDAKRTWGKDNYFLQRLDPIFGNTKDSPDFIEYQAVSVGRNDEQNNNRAWLDMLMSKDSEKRALGEDLLRYAFLTGGVQDNNSFVKFVPNAYLANTDFGNMLKTKGELYQGEASDYNNPSLDMPGFVPQYIQHYPERVYQVDRTVFGDIPAEQNYPESFRMDNTNPVHESLTGENGVREFISYRSPTENRWILYHSNPMDNGEMYYTRIDTLGNQYTDEYDGNKDGIARSIFTENRSLADALPEISGNAQMQSNKIETLGHYYDKVTPYDEIGVREGVGEEVFNRVHRAIIDNDNIPESLKTVAKLLLENPIKDAEIAALREVGVAYKPRLEYDENSKSAASAYYDGKITLKPGIVGHETEAAENFLHEALHERLQGIILMLGYDSKFENALPEDRKKAWESRYNKFGDAHPELLKHVKELDRIRYEAYLLHAEKMGIPATLEGFRKIREGIPVNENERFLYGLQNTQEFVTHIMTDERFRNYLKDISSSHPTSFLDRVFKTISDIFHSIGKALGIVKDHPGALEEALYHTIALTAHDQKMTGDITRAIVNNERITVPSRGQAEGIKQLSEETYGKEALVTNEMTHFALQITNNKVQTRQAIIGPVGKIAAKLKEQIRDAYSDYSKGSLEERVGARARYQELRQDYNDLLRAKSASQLQIMADKQLKWIDKTLVNKNAGATNVLAAINAANMWSELHDIMYGDGGSNVGLDSALAMVQEDAKVRRDQLLTSSAVRVISDALDNRVQLVAADFDHNIKDANVIESSLLTVSNLKPKLVSSIGMLTKEGADNRDEHIDRINKQLSTLEKKMSSLGIKPSDFMQVKSWGLKDRLTGKWNEHINGLAETRDSELDKIIKTEGLTEAQVKERKTQAWAKYWNGLKSTATFVDTRALFDKDGNKLDNKVAFDKLVSEVGSEDYAHELVDQAQEKMKAYAQEREVQTDYTRANLELTVDEEKLSLKEQTVIKNKQLQDKMADWVRVNSPNEFLNKMTGKGDLSFLNDGDRWLSMAPKKEQISFYDHTYNSLMADKFKAPLFKEYKELIQEMTSYLPPEHTQKLGSGFFPIVSNDTINEMSTLLGKLRNFDTTLMQALTASDAQARARFKPNEIPIMYTEAFGKTKEEENRSTDLIKVAKAFSAMALHYRYMAPILDQVNVAESILREVDRKRGSEKGLTNILNAITYNKDRLIFNKPHPLEGKIDYAIYSLNPAKQIKMQNDFKKLELQRKELENQIEEKMGNGEFDIEEEQEKIDKINKQLTDLENQSTHLYGSKMADTLVSVNQFKTVAFNPFSVVPVFCFNSISAMNYGSGRTNYDPSHLREGRMIALHASKNYYTFGAGADSTSDKIRAIMERSQVMTSLHNLDHQATMNQSSHLKNALDPYNWHQAGDYFNKSAVMIAMMLKKEVEVEDKDTGEKKIVRLWDALDKNGKWDTSKYTDNEMWYDADVSKQKEWNRFRDQMRGVAQIVFGNQDKNAPQMAKKWALMRLVGQFRISWLPDAVNTRWGSERFNPLLGRTVKGRYRSFASMGLVTSATIMIRSILDSLPGINVDRFKGLTDARGEEIKDVDMENMRRNFTGLAWTAGISAAILMIKGFATDDKKKGRLTTDARARQLIINMLTRNQEDLMMYASPGTLETITGNIMPASTVLTDTYKAFKATGHYLLGDTHKDKHAFDTWMKHVTRATPILNNINKTEYMLSRDLGDVHK